MHGHSPGSALLLNAEVDSMGGVVDGVGVDSKTSPRRAAIEKAQAELRQEFDVREERRRELEFLEKGGNPLDFKLGPATSISVQSTSLTDQLAEHYVISEAKGSFALTASPHGDSVDSSGRPGAPLGREPNIADNLLLFDGENDTLDGERKGVHPTRRGNIASSEQSSQLDGSNNAKESEDSAIFRSLGVKGQAYARRNRSRSSRDAVSTDLHPSGHGNGSSIFPSRHGSRDAKGSLCEVHMDKDHAVSSICNSKTTSPNGNVVSKILASDNQMDMELDAVQAHDAMTDVPKVRLSEDGADTGKTEHNQHSQPTLVREREDGVSVGPDCVSYAAKAKTENFSSVGQLNGFRTSNRDGTDLENEGQNKRNHIFNSGTAVTAKKGSDSEFSCTRVRHSLDGNVVTDQCSVLRKISSSPDGSSKEQAPTIEGASLVKDANQVIENESKACEAHAVADNDVSLSNSGVQIKIEEEIGHSRSNLQSELKPVTNTEGMELTDHLTSKLEGNVNNSLGDKSNSKMTGLGTQGRPLCTSVSSNVEPPETTVPAMGSPAAPELQNCTESCSKLVDKVHEDAILEEARMIEARLKRAGEPSFSSSPSVKRRKSHWDFVIEEMAWLANDFMQERLWKTTAAAQMSHWVASTGRLKFDEANLRRKQKKVACIFAKAILQFWHSAEVLLKSNDSGVHLEEECDSALFGLRKAKVGAAVKDKIEEHIKSLGTGKNLEERDSGRNLHLPIQRYALRFLKYNSSLDCPVQAEAPTTPERISDSGILEVTWEDRFSEESLFYTVPPGAMENYRRSVESFWAKYEKIGNARHQEEVEASLHDSAAEYGARENAYEDDEGETGVYDLHGSFEGIKSPKFPQRKKKNLQRSYAARPYEVAADSSYGHCVESKMGNQPSLLTVKRPSSSLNVGSIPTKRVRTAARQRVASPFGAGVTGGMQLPNKTDASSGDTSSFQDDQSSLHGGSEIKKNLEVESTGDFGKPTPLDSTEISTKPKKKKAKNLGYRSTMNSTDSLGFVKGSTFEQRWQLDSVVQHEQKDLSKKRLESQQFDSNGNVGMYGQNAAKKPKILKQLPDGSPESITPVNGSMPSPVASQMSNMSNPTKLIKIIANRDRGRKSKPLKMPAGQSGSGSPWSVFEDQALVVLVHDMGPNWELISDAINSTLQFKCIFRKPKECKERHHFLMDRNAGDGADSAEDSGSSQPYPSTLPGIPKGSARQLFERLQGPMEEDTLKSHFEKIILIGQRLHARRSQSDNQELKQIAPVHNSHIIALSQACPNNLNGGPLTPLDLCDATTLSPDVLSRGCQVSHTSSLAIPSHQSPVTPVLPTSGANSMLQGSSGMVLGNSLPSPSTSLNAPARDVHRYGVQRPSSLPMDEQQRMQQQYNQMISGRNIQQPGLPVSGALPVPTDRGVRILPGGSGMGMMSGMNRGMAIPRPGFQGIASPAMLNMVSSGGMPSPVNLHTGAVSGQGNSMLRPRDALQMLRPGQNPEDQRQMMMQELQMQVTQGNGQGVTPFNGLSTAFSNQTIPPPVQSYPVQHQQPHQMPPQPHMLSNPHHPHLQGTTNPSSHQQAYAMRMAKERQLQQRMLHQQQQHQFTTPSASMPHAQAPSQHPMPPLQNNSPIQQQVSAQPASLPSPISQHPLTPSSSPMNPIPQSQQKQHHGPHGLSRNLQAGGNLPNQMLKQQRQRQQQHLQQQQRPHPQQRQQSQQQAKVMKGLGRGNMMLHQNLPVDASHVNSNGLPPASANQVAEKGEQQVMHHLIQGQGLFSGSGSIPVQPGKPLVPQMSSQGQPQPQQQKMFSRPPQPSPKQLQQMSSHLDNSNQGQAQVPPSHTLLGASQPSMPSSSSLSLASQQQQQLQRQTSQSQQTVQRMLHHNRQTSSDAPMQSPADQVQANPQSANGAFQMVPNATLPQCTDSTNAVPAMSSSASVAPSQWKPEPMYDTSTTAPTPQLATMGNLPQPNSVGTEPMSSSSQGLAQRQFSGSGVPVHGHHMSGQWQQQPQPHQPPHQQPQHRQAGQGGVYARPSSAGPG